MIKEGLMRKIGKGLGLAGVLLALSLIAAACAPAADPTATTAATAPTATTAAAATATTAAAPTATTAAGAPTATSAAMDDVKLRPVPVVATPAPDPNAKFGGILRIVDNDHPADWSAWEGAASEPGAAAKVNDTLLEYNAWEVWGSEELLPNVAYDWWTDASGENWTLLLEEGVMYTDGVEFTCADAEFMLETMKNGFDSTGDELRRSPRAGYIQRVEDVSCADDYTLNLTTDGPLPSLPATLATGFFQLYPKHVFEGNLFSMLDQLGPGIGPFMFESYQPGEVIRYARNPEYWNQPYPYMDGIEDINLGARSASTAAIRVGRAELADISSGTKEALVADEFLSHTPKYVDQGFRGLQTNFTREPWNDPRFSLAMRCAIDGQKATDTGYSGFGFESPVFPLEELSGGSKWGLTKAEWQAIGPCHGPSGETDMEARRDIARGLLADMGFTAENPARPFTYVWTPTSVSDHWPSVLDDLQKVNIWPDHTPIETARAYDKNYAGEFDFNIWSYSTPRSDPDTWLYEHFYSTSDRNYGKYTNPEIDALIDLQSVTIDAEERANLVKEISTILLEDNAKIFLVHYGFQEFWAPWLKGYFRAGVNSTGQTSYKHTRQWIDEDLKASLGK